MAKSERILNLRVRYYQDSTPPDIPCREENFIRREIPMSLPVNQTALVLVDMWNIHFIESWIERAREVTESVIVPALNAAREAGLAIVHAPSPEVARKYHQFAKLKPPSPEPEPDWPPAEFRRRRGIYAAYRGPRHQPPGIECHMRRIGMDENLDISPAIKVLDDDYVVATGQQLHELCKERGILHLIYVGFAANWCLLGRDYGMRAMARRGYNVILIREATTGVEFPDTLPRLLVTEMAVREVEQQLGFTVSLDDFIAACRRAASS